MKMRYLCARHCREVQYNSEQAMDLWRGSFYHGMAAFRAGDWRRAERFLGTAYEIGLLRFVVDMQQRQHRLSAAQYAAVGRYYVNVLCQLHDFGAAEICLHRVHDGLLYWSEEKYLPYSERVKAFEQLAEFRQKLVALLKLTGRETLAKCTEVVARQLATQAATGLYH